MEYQSDVQSIGGETGCGNSKENAPEGEPNGPSHPPAANEAPNAVRSQELLTHPASDSTQALLVVAYSPLYTLLWPGPASLYVVAPHRPFQQRNPYVMLRPRMPLWTPYVAAQPQAYQRSGFVVAAAGGHRPTCSNAVGDWRAQRFGQMAAREAGRAVASAGDHSIHARNAKIPMSFYDMRSDRERHNDKERRRRARLMNAFTALRTIVPGLNKKTDNVTVCERTIEYARHLHHALVAMYGPDGAKVICQEFIDKFRLDGTIGELSIEPVGQPEV